MKRGKITALTLTAAITASVCGGFSGCASEKPFESDTGFASVSEVHLSDDYAENALEKEIDYLLSLDEDRLLADFRNNAQLNTEGDLPYGGGWEGSLIGGHTMGHYLSALAQASQNVNVDRSDRNKINSRLESIVDALAECQENGPKQGISESGFLWGSLVLVPAWIETQFDNVEAGRSNIATQAWVPWYTLHKILAGLIDVYCYTGNETAKEVASNLGDWVYRRTEKWDETIRADVLNIEYGGMNDALYNLYRITGDERHAIAAHRFDEDIATRGHAVSLFDEILSDRADYLNGLHANTTIPKVIGALNRYLTLDGKTIGGETVDASDMLTLAEKFFDRVAEHHTYVTGGNSEWEHFGRDDVLDAERTRANCETCNAYNMLKLARMLFTATKDKKYLDFYENTYLNDIWASQNPETGMTTYWQPMATGYFKVYSSPTEHFWCCTGSGMESFTKLNDSIYYKEKDENAVYVSLYLDSELVTDDLELDMDADLEESDKVTIEVEKGESELRLRIPDWTGKFRVRLNGGDVPAGTQDDGFFRVSVKKGDKVEIELEKRLTAHGLPDNPNVYAFKYGPYVLAAELGTKDMTTSTDGVNVTVPARADLGGFSETVTLKSGSRQAFLDDPSTLLNRGENGKFTLTGTDQPLVYSYFFRQYTQRYGVYFTFLGNGEEVEEDTAPYVLDKIDTVQPGYGQYENDEWHRMEDNGSVGSTSDPVLSTSRYAISHGSFTYHMAVTQGKTNYLVLYFAAEDNGKTVLIRSGDTVLYQATLAYEGTEPYYEVLVEIPASVVAAAQAETKRGETRNLIPVTISGIDDRESARIGNYLYTALVTFRENP